MSMSPAERLRRKNEFDGNLVHGAAAFHKVTGRKDHLESKRRSMGRWIDPETGALRKKHAADRLCPLCGEDDSRLLFAKDGFPHVRCKSCDMVYVNPVLNEQALCELYAADQSYNAVLESPAQNELDRLKFVYLSELLEEQLPGKGRILDVGCGPGGFLEIAKDRGWDVCACEPNVACQGLLEGKRIPWLGADLDAVDLEPESLDCLTMWTVLEHVVDPQGYLRKANRLVKRGGLLGVLVPNFHGLANRVLHEKSSTFSGDAHVNFFTRATLCAMLGKTGFETVDEETQLTAIGLINNHLDYQSPGEGKAENALAFLTPEYIHDNFLGYVLMTIARKTA